MTQQKSPFTLSFTEALEIVMKGGWVQGSNFENGLVLMTKGGCGVDGLEHLHVHDFKKGITENPKSEFMLSLNSYNDKFRQVSTGFDAKNKPKVNVLTGLVVA
jgi:hypothetical protein